MLDGPLARRWGAAGALGAALDSIADFTFVLAVLVTLLPRLSPPLPFLQCIASICAVRLASLGVAWCRFRRLRLGLLHTLSNKLAGLLLFLLPLWMSLSAAWLLPWCVVCAVAMLSAAEELAILLLSPVYNPNSISLITLRKDD